METAASFSLAFSNELYLRLKRDEENERENGPSHRRLVVSPETVQLLKSMVILTKFTGYAIRTVNKLYSGDITEEEFQTTLKAMMEQAEKEAQEEGIPVEANNA